MGFRLLPPVLAACFWLGASVPGAAQDVQTRSFQTVDGDRTVLITDFSRGQRAPLVVVLHGALGTSAQIRGYMAWDVVAARERLVIAYPQGRAQSWNDGSPPDGRRFSASQTSDDVAFIRRVVTELTADGRIDRNRVFIAGLGSGGLMTFRLMCEAGDLFAAAAPLLANLAIRWTRACPGRPMPVLMMMGTQDRIAPWAGRIHSGDPDSTLLSAVDSFTFLRLRNGCSGAGERPLPDSVDSDGSTVFLTDGTGCRHATQLYRIEGGGHQTPTRAGRRIVPLTGTMLGNHNNDIEAAEEMWQFFATNSRQGG
ncbi:alpha/beta hydrolase family esterase [Phreatobacter sp.]|uniref:alpha/beta hydrolase family esterase n=1 Tax=Phreatobacter sp. TaxID=1966341 RepID=UPI003F730ACA